MMEELSKLEPNRHNVLHIPSAHEKRNTSRRRKPHNQSSGHLDIANWEFESMMAFEEFTRS